MMFAAMPAMVFAQALQPILGFNYGAKRYSLALKSIKLSIITSTILTMLAFAVVYLIPGPIVRIFTNDATLIDDGIYAARLIFLSLPIMGCVMVGQLFFQAIGKAKQSFITAIARPIVFLIPAVLLLSRVWHLEGVFLSFPVSDILTLMLVTMLALPVIRQFRRLAATQRLGRQELVPAPALGGRPESTEAAD